MVKKNDILEKQEEILLELDKLIKNKRADKL